MPTVARGARGWKPDSVAAVLVFPDAHVHRAAIAEYAALLAASLPGRTWAVRQWLDEPHGDLRAIWFVPITPQVSTKHYLERTRRESSKRRALRRVSDGSPCRGSSVETARDRLPQTTRPAELGPIAPTEPEVRFSTRPMRVGRKPGPCWGAPPGGGRDALATSDTIELTFLCRWVDAARGSPLPLSSARGPRSTGAARSSEHIRDPLVHSPSTGHTPTPARSPQIRLPDATCWGCIGQDTTTSCVFKA